eukprot:TRINITY_DN62185_c0_g1_i1.p1 TRINITY_DN62185_c0_g1~~TRINITY_DN62185_c0_g1_i1.p1  ORF type:complete len:288 (+),score=35.60 TRINITY_DN62185_c0_g1_i1:104-967(+)
MCRRDSYWVCAYANNQHKISQEIDPDPLKTSFFLAMQLCEGVLLVLDSLGTPFTRAWCCFEEAMVIKHFKDLVTLDVVTVHNGRPELLCQGLTASELVAEKERSPGYGYTLKWRREATFPLALLELAYQLDVTTASASVPLDRQRILNCINDVPVELHSSVQPDLESQKCTQVNASLRGLFAEAAVGIAGRQGRLSDALQVLGQDEGRTRLVLDLRQIQALVDTSCLSKDTLRGLCRLELLTVDFKFCRGLANVQGLADSLSMLEALTVLQLGLAWCTALTLSLIHI